MSDSEGRRTINIGFSLGGTRPIPHDALPPEMLERLRAGGTLTDADLAVLSAAAGGSPLGKLLDVVLSSGQFTEIPGQAPSTAVNDDGASIVASGPVRAFEWRFDGSEGASARSAPATYYEALSGRPDPAREWFVNARRGLSLIVTGLAIALPIGATALAIAVGESLETIVFVAIAASMVGLMIKTTFPRTPFG
jgi:hypothetical protein